MAMETYHQIGAVQSQTVNFNSSSSDVEQMYINAVPYEVNITKTSYFYFYFLYTNDHRTEKLPIKIKIDLSKRNSKWASIRYLFIFR